MSSSMKSRARAWMSRSSSVMGWDTSAAPSSGRKVERLFSLGPSVWGQQAGGGSERVEVWAFDERAVQAVAVPVGRNAPRDHVDRDATGRHAPHDAPSVASRVQEEAVDRRRADQGTAV